MIKWGFLFVSFSLGAPCPVRWEPWGISLLPERTEIRRTPGLPLGPTCSREDSRRDWTETLLLLFPAPGPSRTMPTLCSAGRWGGKGLSSSVGIAGWHKVPETVLIWHQRVCNASTGATAIKEPVPTPSYVRVPWRCTGKLSKGGNQSSFTKVGGVLWPHLWISYLLSVEDRSY